MAETPYGFLHGIVRELLTDAKRQALTLIDSKTLKASLEDHVEFQARKITGILRLPQYWAVFYHDGRAGARARVGHKLVYFKDPSRDPRVADGYPIRVRDIRHLSAEEFYYYLKRGMLVVRDSVGPTAGTHFFSQGMHTFNIAAMKRIERRFRAWLLQGLKDDKTLRDTATAEMRLPRI